MLALPSMLGFLNVKINHRSGKPVSARILHSMAKELNSQTHALATESMFRRLEDTPARVLQRILIFN